MRRRCHNQSVPIKIAVIGCGAVSAVGHLPALAQQQRRFFEVAALVDLDHARATELAAQFDVPGVYTSYEAAIGVVDAAVVALPNTLHASVATSLLRAGVHVLVEKPMATRSQDCAAMVEAARDNQAVLMVGMVRRLFPMSAFVGELVRSECLGALESFDVREGTEFRSPVASSAAFRADLAGGGVLIDTGVHVLDLLHQWLGGVRVVSYADDAEGGVEANCLATLSSKGGATGRVELSRTRTLRNTVQLRFSDAAMEVGLGPEAELLLRPKNASWTMKGVIGRDNGASYVSMMGLQLERFAELILGGRSAPITADGADAAIETIEDCYAIRRPLGVPGSPWLHGAPEPIA
jgi:predicted dehydrogenase